MKIDQKCIEFTQGFASRQKRSILINKIKGRIEGGKVLLTPINWIETPK